MGEKRDAHLTISSLKVLVLVETERAEATVYRRKSGGGFAIELHSKLEATIPLPEIDAMLPLAELYERIEFTA